MQHQLGASLQAIDAMVLQAGWGLKLAIEGVPDKSSVISYLLPLTAGIESLASATAINRDPFGGARNTTIVGAQRQPISR